MLLSPTKVSDLLPGQKFILVSELAFKGTDEYPRLFIKLDGPYTSTARKSISAVHVATGKIAYWDDGDTKVIFLN